MSLISYLKMPFKAKIDLASRDDILENMLTISSVMEDWIQAGREEDGLWFRLARCFVKTKRKNVKSAAENLHTRFNRNRSKLKV